MSVMSPFFWQPIFATSIKVRHGFSRFLSILTKASHPVILAIVGPVRPPLILGKLRGAHVSRFHVDLWRSAIPFFCGGPAPFGSLLSLHTTTIAIAMLVLVSSIHGFSLLLALLLSLSCHQLIVSRLICFLGRRQSLAAKLLKYVALGIALRRQAPVRSGKEMLSLLIRHATLVFSAPGHVMRLARVFRGKRYIQIHWAAD